ncbi:MAG: DegV family protein [Roseburia sp.]
MRTAILTDSNSGITAAEAETLGIFVVPMPVIIDGETYFEGKDISETEFYDALCSNKQVSTSMPSPGDVLSLWDSILSQGYDELVYIPMSSGLSNSCAAAAGLSLDYEGRVHIADNHRISVTLRESVYTAHNLAKEGISGREIKDYLEKDAYNSTIYIAVNTLEYLKRGGRVTPAGAALASVLNIKPILTIQGEKLDSFSKARSMKKALDKMVQALQNDVQNRFPDATPDRLRIGTAGTMLSEEETEAWESVVRNAFPGSEVYYNPLSLSIGCHIGPHAFGVGLTRI